MTIKNIIKEALTYPDIQGEPEIAIDEERNVITLSDYREDLEQAFYKKDLCKANTIDVDWLREELDRNNIYYNL